ncbi:MAG TPA: hypothetical protein VJK52_05995, partial [Candidatus Nanoarchaeia archaeon]|nr:hypothetical protein [Candidatus Nanoarchaeia archaeon]
KQHSNRWYAPDNKGRRAKHFQQMLNDPLANYSALATFALDDEEFTLAKFTIQEGSATTLVPQPTIILGQPTVQIAKDRGMFDNLTQKDYHSLAEITQGIPEGKKARKHLEKLGISADRLPNATVVKHRDFISFHATEGHTVSMYPLAIEHSAGGVVLTAQQQPAYVHKGNWFERLWNDQWELAKKEQTPKPKWTTDVNGKNHKKGFGKVQMFGVKRKKLNANNAGLFLGREEFGGQTLAEFPILIIR